MFFAAAAAAATTATLSSRRGRFLFVHVRLRPLVAVRATVNVAGLVGVPHTEVLKALAVADELRVDALQHFSGSLHHLSRPLPGA